MSFLNKIKNIISKKTEVATALFFRSSTTKQTITSSCTLKLSSKTEELKKQIHDELKTKIKKYMNAPEKLLQYLQLKGIKVYRIKNAEKILAYLKEEEGFVTPLKGFKAIVLNAILNKSFGLTTKEMITLIALINAPSYYSTNIKEWNNKKNTLTEILYKNNIISFLEYQEALKWIK